jgi:hypothetical protein
MYKTNAKLSEIAIIASGTRIIPFLKRLTMLDWLNIQSILHVLSMFCIGNYHYQCEERKKNILLSFQWEPRVCTVDNPTLF